MSSSIDVRSRRPGMMTRGERPLRGGDSICEERAWQRIWRTFIGPSSPDRRETLEDVFIRSSAPVRVTLTSDVTCHVL